jgi:hypothetical protein
MTSSSKFVSSFSLFALSTSFTPLWIYRTILLQKKCLCTIFSWILLTFFSWACNFPMRPWIERASMFCSERMIFSTTHVSFIFSQYLLIWLYIANTLTKYSEIFSYSSMCNFSKSPHSFYRCTFLTFPAPWFDSCKTFYACLVVAALVTISKVASSRYWWMIVSAC